MDESIDGLVETRVNTNKSCVRIRHRGKQGVGLVLPTTETIKQR
jgi:hypothetical protein